jgi:hypothetical protein
MGMRMVLALLLLLAPVVPAVAATADERVLDDFQRADGRARDGAVWRYFADTVMGGVSRGGAVRDSVAGRMALRLTGQVSLENNGGFLQVALLLAGGGGVLDASEWTGVRLVVRGNGAAYQVHLRTRQTRLPWQYYEAGFSAGPEWTTVDLPFSRFTPEALGAPLDPRQLQRIGLVAAERAYRADLAVARVSLYREAAGAAVSRGGPAAR